VTLRAGPLNYLFVHSTEAGAYCLGVFDNHQQGTLLGGITFRNVYVQVCTLQRFRVLSSSSGEAETGGQLALTHPVSCLVALGTCTRPCLIVAVKPNMAGFGTHKINHWLSCH
jgi:hypothetical protein